jgi:transcriptional regulator with XRE-family HTH domain
MGSNHRIQSSPRRRSRSFPVNGVLLQSLRVASGWTQEETATRSDLSDRLIRKAEAGGPLEIQSIAVLAQLYSSVERRFTPDDLLADPVVVKSAAGTSRAAGSSAPLFR